MKVQFKIPVTVRNASNGELTSYNPGQIVETTDQVGGGYVSAGYADEYTLLTPSGKKTISENGTNIDVSTYAKADVSVPTGVFPTGNLEITENGENIDVTEYATVTVNVTTSAPETPPDNTES